MDEFMNNAKFIVMFTKTTSLLNFQLLALKSPCTVSPIVDTCMECITTYSQGPQVKSLLALYHYYPHLSSSRWAADAMVFSFLNV